MEKLGLEVNKSDIEGCTIILSCLVPQPQFAGQTKYKLNNEELRKPFGDWFQGQFEKILKKNSIIVDKIVNGIIERDAAKSIRDSNTTF